MKRLLLIMVGCLMMSSCGIDVRVDDPIEVNHRINIDGIIEFCNNHTDEDVQQCIDDLKEILGELSNADS